MRYRNNRYSKPAVRTITVKFAGACACCGATIKTGEMADYYPVGTIASRTTPAIAHMGTDESTKLTKVNSMSYNAKSDLDHGAITPLTIEASLLAAYRAGRHNYTAGAMSPATVNKWARELYATERERECFIAGYFGDRKRAWSAQSSTTLTKGIPNDTLHDRHRQLARY